MESIMTYLQMGIKSSRPKVFKNCNTTIRDSSLSSKNQTTNFIPPITIHM